jgi:hypothetical protein
MSARNPFEQPDPQPERPRRPRPNPFAPQPDPFARLGNPFAGPLSDSDAAYWTAVLVYEIAEFLDGGDGR